MVLLPSWWTADPSPLPSSQSPRCRRADAGQTVGWETQQLRCDVPTGFPVQQTHLPCCLRHDMAGAHRHAMMWIGSGCLKFYLKLGNIGLLAVTSNNHDQLSTIISHDQPLSKHYPALCTIISIFNNVFLLSLTIINSSVLLGVQVLGGAHFYPNLPG